MIEPQSSDLNPWIRVASFEVYLILDRWGLSSVRDASVFLGISRHTLSKLSPSHPDGSLRLESLDRVYATFLHLVSFHFPEKERVRLLEGIWFPSMMEVYHYLESFTS